MFKYTARAAIVTAFVLVVWGIYHIGVTRRRLRPAGNVEATQSTVTPLWFQSNGEDNPASVENVTPFPSSHFIVNAQWTTPRYYPNPKVQAADIIPVTWADDGYSYFVGDDGSVHGTKGTTVFARILGVPPNDNRVPQIDFQLLAHDAFLYGCPKSVTPNSCYSVGLTSVNGVFYAPTYDQGYPVVGDHPPGHARIDYSLEPPSQTSWVHGTVDFPDAVGSGTVSFVEIGKGAAAQDGCSGPAFPHGCIYAIVLQGGYQDPKDPCGIDQFIATKLYLARMAAGTAEHNYQEVTHPANWQWFAGFDAANHPTWVQGSEANLARDIRSLSYPRQGRSGCGVEAADCVFWDRQTSGSGGHLNYPHMAYDRQLDRYLLTFADYYYRDFQPPSESGPMVQGGAELIVLEAPHPWGPWSFVMRNPFIGSGNAYGPSLPVQWQGPSTPTGQDLWMIWAANFAGCGHPLLVPADLCQGVYGMNLRRLHLTVAGTVGTIPRPWVEQDVGFASPGNARLRGGTFELTGNGNLALRPDPFHQYNDQLEHDAFHYVFQRLEGNAELEAELHPGTPKANAGPEASAGLMLRESDYVIGQTQGPLRGRQLSPGDVFSEAARYGYLGVFPDGSVAFQWRDQGRVSRGDAQSRACAAGCLLKIVRRGNQVRAFFSAAHGPWREAGSHDFSPDFSPSATFGMVATSDSVSTFPEYASYSASFEKVQLRPGP